MKTKEELTVLKEEVETLNKKLAELTEEELVQVTGGITAESYIPAHPYHDYQGKRKETTLGIKTDCIKSSIYVGDPLISKGPTADAFGNGSENISREKQIDG